MFKHCNSFCIKLIGLVSISFFGACSTPPKVDQNWLAQNCSPISSFSPDSCSVHSNCETVSESICACSHDNGVYHGQLLRGQRHGKGSYTWNDKTVYAGYWLNNNKHCGVESSGNNFHVFQQGSIIDSGGSAQWAEAFAGALIIGTAGYLAGQGGYSGYSSPYSSTDYDWDWDYQPGNGQWICRGIQTGQYAELENCAYDLKDDDRWP